MSADAKRRRRFDELEAGLAIVTWIERILPLLQAPPSGMSESASVIMCGGDESITSAVVQALHVNEWLTGGPAGEYRFAMLTSRHGRRIAAKNGSTK